MFFKRKKAKPIQTLPDDPALPADVREFAEKHASNTNFIDVLNDIYRKFDCESERVEMYQFAMKSLQELMHWYSAQRANKKAGIR